MSSPRSTLKFYSVETDLIQVKQALQKVNASVIKNPDIRVDKPFWRKDYNILQFVETGQKLGWPETLENLDDHYRGEYMTGVGFESNLKRKDITSELLKKTFDISGSSSLESYQKTSLGVGAKFLFQNVSQLEIKMYEEHGSRFKGMSISPAGQMAFSHLPIWNDQTWSEENLNSLRNCWKRAEQDDTMKVKRKLSNSISAIEKRLDNSGMIYEQDDLGFLFSSFTRLFALVDFLERIILKKGTPAPIVQFATDFKRTIHILVVETTMCHLSCLKVDLQKASNIIQRVNLMTKKIAFESEIEFFVEKI